MWKAVVVLKIHKGSRKFIRKQELKILTIIKKCGKIKVQEIINREHWKKKVYQMEYVKSLWSILITDFFYSIGNS